MGLRIATNMASLSAQKTLGLNQSALQKADTQLASGSRITKSADDAAGLSISESLKSQIRGFQQAQRNANDGISLVQVSEGGLGEISNILTRLRELAVQAASDTVGDVERGFVNKETQQLKLEMQRIALTARWGSQNLLDGTGKNFAFQVDINNNDYNDRIAFDASQQNATVDNLGVADLDYSDKDGARKALEHLEDAQRQVNGYRANLGAIQNRLVSTSENLGTAIENFSAANSRIRDTDIAQASADMARNNILQQASISVLTQANTQPMAALHLIQS